MFSALLTKINTTPMAFKDEILLKKQPVNEKIQKFVFFCNPNETINVYDDYIEALNSKSVYHFYNYGTHFKRINIHTGVKKWYTVC